MYVLVFCTYLFSCFFDQVTEYEVCNDQDVIKEYCKVPFNLEGIELQKSDTIDEKTRLFHNAHLLLFNHQEFNRSYTEIKSLVSFAKKNKDTTLLYYVLYLEAHLLQLSESQQKSIETFENILSLKLDKMPLDFFINYRLGVLNLKKRSYDKATNYFLRAEKLFLDNNICELRALSLYNGIAFNYLHKKEYAVAESYYKQALLIGEKLKDTINTAVIHSNLGNLYFEQYQDQKAKKEFLTSLNYLEMKDSLNFRRNVYYNLFAVHEALNEDKKALMFLQKYAMLQDSIWNRDKVWELAEKDKQYEVNLREKEMAVMKRVQEAELASQRWQTNTYLSAAFFLLIIAGISGWGYRKVKKSNGLILNQKLELEQLNNTKNRLFTIIAHDLKSPVISLQKSQQKMTQAISDKDEAQINAIASENETLLDNTQKLLNNTLQWALDQTNQFHFNPELIEVKRLIEMIVYDYRGMVKAKNINLSVDVEPNMIISVDLHSIKTALRNLLDNAIKFTPTEGNIIVTGQHKNDLASISIKDTGCGIDRDRLSKLFEVNSAKIQKDTTGRAGTGLGLMISNTLVQRNSGEILVESEVQCGTNMILNLPLFKPAQV